MDEQVEFDWLAAWQTVAAALNILQNRLRDYSVQLLRDRSRYDRVVRPLHRAALDSERLPQTPQCVVLRPELRSR